MEWRFIKWAQGQVYLYSVRIVHTSKYLVSWGGVRLSLFGTLATFWPVMSAPDDDDYYDYYYYYQCGAVGGMRIYRGNHSTRRKPGPDPVCPQQIPHDLAWARSRRLTV
jgi:hypothetical protein